METHSSLPTQGATAKKRRPSCEQDALRGGQDGPSRERRRQLAEHPCPGKGEREPHEQPARRLRDNGRHFQELQPERIKLGPTELRRQWRDLSAQGMKEDICRGVFEQTKEVRDKRRTREAIGVQCIFEIFDEILTLPPLTIRVIEQRRSELRKRRHDKARIGAALADFRFHDHVASLRPRVRGIGKGVEVLHS